MNVLGILGLGALLVAGVVAVVFGLLRLFAATMRDGPEGERDGRIGCATFIAGLTVVIGASWRLWGLA